jgi:hypothetical protein
MYFDVYRYFKRMLIKIIKSILSMRTAEHALKTNKSILAMRNAVHALKIFIASSAYAKNH